MPEGDSLGVLELAALEHPGDDACGMTVRREIEARTGRAVFSGAVYGTLVVGRSLGAYLVGGSGHDVGLLVAAVATFVPARRASRVGATTVLRAERGAAPSAGPRAGRASTNESGSNGSLGSGG